MTDTIVPGIPGRSEGSSPLGVLAGCCTISLEDGRNMLLDHEDWLVFSGTKFGVHFEGDRALPYIKSGSRRKKFGGHWFPRVMFRDMAGKLVDHRNGDTLDNRRTNLRICTRLDNARNQRKIRGVSRFKGVGLHRGKWLARIRGPESKVVHLGYFASERDAALAYDRAARQYHGEFACTNADLMGSY